MNTIINNLNKLPIEEFEKALYNINMSARKIKKSYISCTGYFASYKNKTQIAFESVLERDFYMLLEFDDNVVSYAEQPITINYEYKDGSKRRYTPDCVVSYKDRSERYFEVKYASEIRNDLELKEKLDFLKEYFYDENNLYFDIFTDEEIGKIYMENLKFLYKFAFIPDDFEKMSTINALLNQRESLCVKEILNIVSDKQVEQLRYLPYIWRYVFLNNNVVNLYEKLTMNSILKK